MRMRKMHLGVVLLSALAGALFLSRHSFTRFSGTMELRVTDVRGNCNYVVSCISKIGRDFAIFGRRRLYVNKRVSRFLKHNSYIIRKIPINFFIFDKYIEN